MPLRRSRLEETVGFVAFDVHTSVAFNVLFLTCLFASLPEANSSFFAKPKRSVGALDRAQGAVMRLKNESQDTSFAGLVSYSLSY